MDKDTIYKFQKRWRALQNQQKDLDYQIALFCRDFRDQFPKGDVGDRRFIKAAAEFLNDVDEKQAINLLTRARATAVVPDEKVYRVIGGHTHLDKLALHDKKEQMAIIEIAVKDGYTVGHAIGKRDIQLGKREAPPPPPNHRANAEAFAKFIKRSEINVPKDIELLLKHYL